MIRIHREGKKVLSLIFVGLVLINLAIIFFKAEEQVQNSVLVISIFIYSLFLLFYRNPKRFLAVDNQKIIAPVDGKIVGIKEIEEQSYFKDKRLQVSIYSSPFRVHVSKFPISGLVKYLRKRPGAFLFAWHEKASSLNEQTLIVIENEDGKEIMYRQIAGALGRKYGIYAKEGITVSQGAEAGFNGFASRLDLILPLDSSLLVKIGDKTLGGQQIIAELK